MYGTDLRRWTWRKRVYPAHDCNYLETLFNEDLYKLPSASFFSVSQTMDLPECPYAEKIETTYTAPFALPQFVGAKDHNIWELKEGLFATFL